MRLGSTIILSALLVSGCSTTSRLAGAPMDFFPVPPDAPDVWAATGVEATAPAGDWLSQFEDETMMQLVNEALTANPSLSISEANLRASRAALRSADGRRQPQLTASGSAGGTSAGVEILGDIDRINDPSFGLGRIR